MAGAPTSYGYPGSVNAAILADWLTRAASARFSVVGKDDWKVSVQPGLDRGVRINGGIGIGDGVMDDFPDYDTRSLPLVASGSQWFLIAARRNWSTPASTNFVVIPGTATKAMPSSGISDSPGQESDQPIALVRVVAGNTVVQDIVDLRAWAGNGGVEAVDLLGRGVLARPGAAVKVGATVYRYEYDPANGGSFKWNAPYAEYAPIMPNGYSADGRIYVEQVGDRRRVTLDFRITRTGDPFPVQTDWSGFGAVIPTQARGTSWEMYLPVALAGGNGNNHHASIFVNPTTGQIGIRSQQVFTWLKGARFTVNYTYYI